MSRYRLYVESKETPHVVEGKSPTKALRELVEKAGLSLFSQDGRYGRTTNGQHVMALTEAWSRRRLDPQERTTRL